MRVKHLLWIVPLLVVVFAFLPQPDSWESEAGYDHPFPGFWSREGQMTVSELMSTSDLSYHGQLIRLRLTGECWPGVDTQFCHRQLGIFLGWQPKTHEETVILVIAEFGNGSEDRFFEMTFSPAFGDNPERDGPIGVIYNSTTIYEWVEEASRPYRLTRLFLTGRLAEERQGCEEVYFLRELEGTRRRLDTGCLVSLF